MSRIKILEKRSSFIERSITFEVDGKLETISAPAANATFDELIKRIESTYGDGASEKPKTETESKDKEFAQTVQTGKTSSASKSKKKTTAQSGDTVVK